MNLDEELFEGGESIRAMSELEYELSTFNPEELALLYGSAPTELRPFYNDYISRKSKSFQESYRTALEILAESHREEPKKPRREDLEELSEFYD